MGTVLRDRTGLMIMLMSAKIIDEDSHMQKTPWAKQVGHYD